MISYFYVKSEIFSENYLRDERNCLFILQLIRFLTKGTFILVINKATYNCFLKNKESILDNMLRKKIGDWLQAHITKKKIRYIRQDLDDPKIDENLLKFETFDKFINLHKKKIDDKAIFFDLKEFTYYELSEQKKLNQGKIFNSLNEIDIEKILLGTSFINFTIYNFIDSIFEPKKIRVNGQTEWQFEKFHNDPKNLIDRSILSYSLDYICQKLMEARSNDKNFLEKEDTLILNIHCRTKKDEKFFYNYKDQFKDFIRNFLSKELYQYPNINKFFECNGVMNLKLYPQYLQGAQTLDSEETHWRYLQSDNGVFSIAKDLDLFELIKKFYQVTNDIDNYKSGTRSFSYIKFGSLKYRKSPIRIKFSSTDEPFISFGFDVNPPVSISFNEFFS